MPSPKSQGPSLNLERVGQVVAQRDPTWWAEALSHYTNAPAQVTSWRYPTQQAE